MKEIVFANYDRCSRNVTIKITDEKLFKQKVAEWIEQEGSLNYWNLEESHFQDCVEMEYEEWQQEGEEDDDDFHIEMGRIGIETYAE